MYFTPNLSLLRASLPLAGRFEQAAAAGFRAVEELWWPGDEAARALPGLAAKTEAGRPRSRCLNFDGGDLAAGQRGLAADPRRRGELRAHVPEALAIARDCGCARLNLLVGQRLRGYSRGQQWPARRTTSGWAADRAAAAGCEVTIEALSPATSGDCLLTTTAAAAAFIAGTGRRNVRLQYDAFHMQQTEGNLTATIDAHFLTDRPHPDRRRAGPARAGDRGDQLPLPARLPGRPRLQRRGRARVHAVPRRLTAPRWTGWPGTAGPRITAWPRPTLD